MIELDPDLQEHFAPWVTALRRMLGPLGRRVLPDRGAPDGFDGIARRGPYDRLLASEWALADEAPDEFLRRAADGELSFLRLVRREPVRARASVALVDAGPAQLGGPRVGHLPVMIALAERAAAAGARFAVQVIHTAPPGEPGGEALLGDGTVGALSSVMRASSLFEPEPATVRAWLDFARRAGWDDLWIVGGRNIPGLDRAPPRTVVHRVVVREEAPRSLRVEVRQHRAVRAATFELPTDARCFRVLSGRLREAPHRPPAPPPARSRRFDIESTPVLLADGRKLVGRTPDHNLVLLTVPDWAQPNERRPGHPRLLVPPYEERAIAVGWYRRRVVILGCGRHGLALYDHCNDRIPHTRTALALPDDVAESARGMRPDAPLGALLVDAGPTTYWLDPRGRVFRFRQGAVEEIDRDVLAMEFVMGHVRRLARTGPPHDVTRRVGEGMRGFLGEVGIRREATAIEREPGVWEMSDGPSTTLVPPDLAPIGITDQVPHGVHLVALSADRRAVVALRGSASPTILTEPAAITHALLTARGRRVALRRADGVVRVYDLERKAWLLSTPAGGYP